MKIIIMIFNDATPVLYSYDLIFQVSCKVTWLLYISSCSGQLAYTELPMRLRIKRRHFLLHVMSAWLEWNSQGILFGGRISDYFTFPAIRPPKLAYLIKAYHLNMMSLFVTSWHTFHCFLAAIKFLFKCSGTWNGVFIKILDKYNQLSLQKL